MNFSDPLFLRAINQLSLEAQKYLQESGLDDPSVLECFLSDPDKSPAESPSRTSKASSKGPASGVRKPWTRHTRTSGP